MTNGSLNENAQAIREAQAAGIEFMVATGRGVTEAKPLLAAQNLKPAFITLNGAMVFDEAGKLVVTIPIADDLNDYIVKTLQKTTFTLKLSPTKASSQIVASSGFKMLPICSLI